MFPRLSARLRARRRFVIALLAVTVPAATILPFVPPLIVEASSTPTLLGEQNWYTLDRHQLWDKADLAVNVASGDLIFHEADLDIQGYGANNLILERYYNSLSNGAGGGADFGSDWVMTAGGDVKLTIGTSITYQGPSSFQQVFTGTAPNWTAPAGIDATLYGPNGSLNYTLTYHNNGQVLTFNSTGQLITNADRNGNAITYYYNGNGTLQELVDSRNRAVLFNYGGNGNVSSMVDNTTSRTYTYTINGSHNLTGYADPANPSKTAIFAYDTLGKHELVDIKDPAGNGETKLTYDTNHRVTELQFVYDTTGDTYNRTYTYNSGTTGSRCDSSLSPAGNTVVTDEDSHNTDYCWDSSGRVIEKVDGDGNKTITTWNSDDKPLTVKDANGNTTTYAYNDSFAPNENLTSVTQAPEASWGGAVTSYTYGASTNHYAPTKVTQPQLTSFSYTYDGNGNPSTLLNGLSSQNTVTQYYGSNGLLNYGLDAKGDAAPNCFNGSTPMTQCYSYDIYGELIKKVTPATTDNYTNDGVGRVISHTDGNGNVTTYTYDGDDRVTQILYGGATTCSYPSVNCTTLQYDADGNLQTLKDQTGTSTYTQDKLNRLASQTESGSTSTVYTLDGVGNLTKIVNGLGSSNPINYSYDAANRLTGLWTGTGASCSASPSTCTQFTYDSTGNRKSTSYPNGVSLSMNFDNENHLKQISSAKGATTISNDQYDYHTNYTTDVNQKQYFVDLNGHGYAYYYDALNGLYEALSNDTALYPTYYYPADANANNCGRTDGSACQGGTSDPLRCNSANEMTYNNGITFATPDSNGNTTSWSTSNDHGGFGYNAQNQLSSETHGSTTISYTYRGIGQGDRATANGSFGNQSFTYDSLGLSMETNSAQSACPCYYVHDTSGTLVEEILTGTGGGTYYPVFDGDGSVIALTDGSGNVVDTMTYGPANLIASTGSVYEPFFFQGKYMDQTGGSQSNEAAGNEQYQNGQRSLQMGWMATTWNQQDPMDSPFETHGWNRYNYAGQDPVNLADPNGILFGRFGDWVANTVSSAASNGRDWAGVGWTWGPYVGGVVGGLVVGSRGGSPEQITGGVGAGGLIGKGLGWLATGTVGFTWSLYNNLCYSGLCP